MLEEAKRIRVRKPDGKYKFDNKHLEFRNEWEEKNDELEKKYKDNNMPKIAFHTLDKEGEIKFIQAKKDKIW
jgi:hypothetical protein